MHFRSSLSTASTPTSFRGRPDYLAVVSGGVVRWFLAGVSSHMLRSNTGTSSLVGNRSCTSGTAVENIAPIEMNNKYLYHKENSWLSSGPLGYSCENWTELDWVVLSGRYFKPGLARLVFWYYHAWDRAWYVLADRFFGGLISILVYRFSAYLYFIRDDWYLVKHLTVLLQVTRVTIISLKLILPMLPVSFWVLVNQTA